MSNSVDEVLRRMCRAYQVADDDMAALALRLEMDEKTFRVWRTRKSVPPKALIQVSAETGRTVQWLQDGAAATAGYSVSEDAPPKKFRNSEKQISVTPEELALLQNYRAASEEGRRMLSAAGAAVAKSKVKKEKAA